MKFQHAVTTSLHRLRALSPTLPEVRFGVTLSDKQISQITSAPDTLVLTSAFTASAFPISAGTMCEELGCSTIEAQAGIGLYAWGAGIMPLFIAPISEELGRRPIYLAAAVTFLLFHVMNGA